MRPIDPTPRRRLNSSTADRQSRYARFIAAWKKAPDDRLLAADAAGISLEEIDEALSDKSNPENKQQYDEVMRRRLVKVQDAHYRIAASAETPTATREFLRVNDPNFKGGDDDKPPADRQRDKSWMAQIQSKKKPQKASPN